MTGRPSCTCLHCRIRAACGLATNGMVDIVPVIGALSDTLAQLLGFVPDERAAAMLADLHRAHEHWRTRLADPGRHEAGHA